MGLLVTISANEYFRRPCRQHRSQRAFHRTFGQDRPGAATKKLSHNEGREFASIEKRIAKAEEDLLAKRAALEDPEISSDAPRLHTAYLEMESAQKTVDELYARWAELGQRTPEQLEK